MAAQWIHTFDTSGTFACLESTANLKTFNRVLSYRCMISVSRHSTHSRLWVYRMNTLIIIECIWIECQTFCIFDTMKHVNAMNVSNVSNRQLPFSHWLQASNTFDTFEHTNGRMCRGRMYRMSQNCCYFYVNIQTFGTSDAFRLWMAQMRRMSRTRCCPYILFKHSTHSIDSSIRL